MNKKNKLNKNESIFSLNFKKVEELVQLMINFITSDKTSHELITSVEKHSLIDELTVCVNSY